MQQFSDWTAHNAHMKQSFGNLAQKHPKMFEAYKALTAAVGAEGLDAKTRELIAIAVAVTTRCDGCIAAHAEAAVKAGATENEIAGALATAIAMNAGAAYTYSLHAMEAIAANK